MEKKYELIGLFATKVNDIVAEKTLADQARKTGFKVLAVDKWGMKPLAYPIKKEVKAYFLRLEIEGGEAGALRQALKVEETVLRYLLVKTLGGKGGKDERQKS